MLFSLTWNHIFPLAVTLAGKTSILPNQHLPDQHLPNLDHAAVESIKRTKQINEKPTTIADPPTITSS